MEKEKLVYESPELEVIDIALEDIVTTSGSAETTPGQDDMEGDGWWT